MDIIRQKLIPLADRTKIISKDLIKPSEYFQFYISPFEALQIELNESANVIDVKVVQRAKKRLLQEVDLNDGKVSWLGDYSLSKSRALTIGDELLDDRRLRYHLAIFQNQRLLRFLTRGDIDRFLYADDYFPKETIEFLEKDPDFHSFLSKPFAQQYNLLLSRALELQLLPVVEVLFNGRRWVLPEDDDTCFEGANKQVNYLANLLQIEVNKGEKEKPDLLLLESLLHQHKFPDIFNLLPVPFRPAQTNIVAKLRALAISCYNNYGDTDLSQDVLNLCKRFRFKNIELNKKLEEDSKTIAEMIAEERKYEVKLVFNKDRSFEITKDGIRDGNKFLPVSSINKMRWGITIIGYTGGAKYDYLVVITNDAGKTIKASWCVYNEGELVPNSTKHFNSIVQATLNYLADTVIKKIQSVLLNEQSVIIGPCTLTKGGVEFKSQGFLFKKSQFIRWLEISTEIKNGHVIVYKTSQSNVTTTMSARETDNAVLLPIITSIMQNKNP
ncbi:MAG: hypothetical protein QY310_06550 [Candidatus Jettenia sp. CY-1]|nr:MAG: hypothetical protein QY310_06550 [Candidatus Jettenia sp. CY-1]